MAQVTVGWACLSVSGYTQGSPGALDRRGERKLALANELTKVSTKNNKQHERLMPLGGSRGPDPFFLASPLDRLNMQGPSDSLDRQGECELALLEPQPTCTGWPLEPKHPDVWPRWSLVWAQAAAASS